MYRVSVSRTFVAQHFLTVPDPGPEGTPHSHTFTVKATVFGPELNRFEYLVDIDDLSAGMDATVERFRDQLLNDLPEFEGHNPSAERLARVFAEHLLEHITPEDATQLDISVQEDDVATVGYRTSL